MKLYAPKYYSHFSCIADRCKHSCCVGWEIDVDEESLRAYAALEHPYGKTLMASISREDTPHFCLTAGERCPHLEPNGLCRVILELGESYLCEICREHPRFYNDTSRGREVGLGMACEEACRLILSSDGYGEWIEVGEVSGEALPEDFAAAEHRDRWLALLADGSRSYAARLEELCKTCGIDLSSVTDAAWRALLDSLEYLDETHRAWFSCFSTAAPTDARELWLERALAYFLFRHCARAEDAWDLRARAGFCLFCERLLASLAESRGVDSLEAMILLAQTVSEELEYSEENTAAIRDAVAEWTASEVG
ncbi:MAG: flagellin lysine-N-methylase [Clostridia bacterium]|nr:flagellin lysine-N-methylase [Clostridia bacterium]